MIGDFNRECLAIDVDFSLPTKRVIRSLEKIIECCGKPSALRCDNGPEYISQELVDWTNNLQITLQYIQPGKPTQNAYVERFNGTARREWLELNVFEDIEHAQLLAHNGNELTIMNALIQQLVAYRPGNYCSSITLHF